MPDLIDHDRLPPAPPGFLLRRAEWEDLDAVVALHVAADRHPTASSLLRSEDLRMRWLGLDSLDDALLVTSLPPEPVLVAYGAFDHHVDLLSGRLELHVEGTVRPGANGRGLASFLLAEAEARARRAASRLGAPALLRTSLVDGDEPARAWFAARGFVSVRHLLELRLDLHAPPPAPVWREGISYRTFRPGRDEAALHAAHQAAFADVPTHLPMDREDFLDDRLRRFPELDPELILLAEHGDEVIGIAVCRAGTEVAAEDGWVRDLGVVPRWRRHGVGMALLRTAFAAFRARGLTGVALEVDDVTLGGAAALYRRAGMRTVRRTDVLERHLEDATVPG